MVNNQWLIIELSEFGETLNYPELENGVLELFGDNVDYFIPIHREIMGSYVSTSVLFEGYIFVKDSTYVRDCLVNLSDFKMFSKVLKGSGKFQTVDSKTVGLLKRKLKASIKKQLSLGTKVFIKDGMFKNLTGKVMGIEDNGKKVMVQIERLSRQMVAPIPSTSVQELKS